MKWYFLFLLAVVFSFSGNAQNHQTIGTPNTLVISKGGLTADSALLATKGDTTNAPYKDSLGVLRYFNGNFYITIANGAHPKWQLLATPSTIHDSSGNYTNSNVGSFYRLAVPNTRNIKTLAPGYGMLNDSTTNTNAITQKADTATLFPAVRATIPTGAYNFIVNTVDPVSGNGNNGDYFWNKVKGQMSFKSAGSWAFTNYLYGDTVVPSDPVLYKGPIMKVTNVWDTAAQDWVFANSNQNPNAPGNNLLPYKGDPTMFTGWNMTTQGAVQVWKPFFGWQHESNYDTKGIGDPWYEDHVVIGFKPGSPSNVYATGERIESINASQVAYDIYKYNTKGSEWWWWRESPGAGLTHYFDISPGGIKWLRNYNIDSIPSGGVFGSYDGVSVWSKQLKTGLNRYLISRGGFEDTATLDNGTGGDFWFRNLYGTQRTVFTGTMGIGGFNVSDADQPIVLDAYGGRVRFWDDVRGFTFTKTTNVYGLTLNKLPTRPAYLDITNADRGAAFNAYFNSNISTSFPDSIINPININFEKQYNSTYTTAGMGTGYSFNLNNGISAFKTSFNSNQDASSKYLADFVWSSESTGGSTLLERMRLTNDGFLGINKSSPLQRLHVGGQVQIDTLTNGTAGTDSVLVVNAAVVKKVSASSIPTNLSHTIFTPSTGGTVNLNAHQYNIINPSGALVALTVNLPSSPANGDVVYIKYTQAITTVTYGNGTVVDGITAPTAGGLVMLTYDSGTTSWY